MLLPDFNSVVLVVALPAVFPFSTPRQLSARLLRELRALTYE